MTEPEIAQRLLEYDSSKEKSVELDRLLLRIVHFPSLAAALVDIGQKGDKAELSFVNLPDDVIDDVRQIIGPTDIEVFKFKKDGKPMVGYRFSLDPLAEITNAEPDPQADK